MPPPSRSSFLFSLLLVLTGSLFAGTGLADDRESARHLAALLRIFHFQPIAQEGGFYFSTYHSEAMLPGPTASSPGQLAGSAIYFLLKPGDFSALHRLKEDEIYHYYNGSPIALLQLFPDGTGRVTICGPEFWKGQEPQVVVKHDVWQGSRPLEAKTYALLGTTMTPGFDASDFKLGKRDELIRAYPRFAGQIKALTREPAP